jgi:transcriptional regulator with XRE-family HTH domain
LDEKTVVEKIRRIRRNKNITLRALAKETSLTVGYLSRIENSQTLPPIPTLERIARGLGIDIGYLLLTEEKQTNLKRPNPDFVLTKKKEIRESRAPHNSGEKGYNFETLALGMPLKHMHPYLLIAKSGFSEVQQHDGEEFIYILEGSLEFLHGSDKYVMAEGDCAYFNAHIPHCGRGIGKNRAKVLTIIYDYKGHNQRI